MEALFAGTGVTTVVVGPEVGQASAAKQAYALFNKGRVVLAPWPTGWLRRTASGTSSRPRASAPTPSCSASSTRCATA